MMCLFCRVKVDTKFRYYDSIEDCLIQQRTMREKILYSSLTSFSVANPKALGRTAQPSLVSGPCHPISQVKDLGHSGDKSMLECKISEITLVFPHLRINFHICS